jgi:hypothetical protein
VSLNAPTSSEVIRQLARFEGRRQLKSPFLWLAVAGSIALVWLAVHDQPPTLWARSVTIAGSCLPIAISTLLLANVAALRDHSSRVGETTDAPPISKDLRMLGLAAGAWAALLLSLVVVVLGIVLSVTDDPAGSFMVPELVVGPLLVLLGQVAGVVLGRWIPNPLAAPLTLILLAGLFIVQDVWPGERSIPAASPFLPWRKSYTLDWVQGEPRMPWVHLIYLVGLIAMFTALASHRWRALIAAGVLVVGSGIGLSRIETDGEEVVAAIESWSDARSRTCEEHDGIRYCAIEGYEPWIDDWAEVVERVDELVPDDLRVAQVEQTVSGLDSFEDLDPTVAHVHGRLDMDDDLTQQVLAPELGLPGTGGEAAAMNTDIPACMAGTMPMLVSGEARGVAFLVLTDLSVPGSIETGGFGGTYWFGHLEVSEEEARLAFQIVDRPESEVIAAFHAHWAEVTHPSTSSAELAGWFDLAEPEVISAARYESMQCACTDGGVSCTSGP